MTKEETIAQLEEDVKRYEGYVEADTRDLQRAKLTLDNNKRLLKLAQAQLDQIKKA